MLPFAQLEGGKKKKKDFYKLSFTRANEPCVLGCQSNQADSAGGPGGWQKCTGWAKTSPKCENL